MTVYVTPMLARGATVNDPEMTPPDTAQSEFKMKRPLGDEDTVQLLSVAEKPEAAIETTVQEGPDIGVNVICGVTRNCACAESPASSLTVTAYAPVASDATVNDPDTRPADAVQEELANRPLGDEDIVQAVSLIAKLDPETSTLVPGGP
jgi:hypothetical protein